MVKNSNLVKLATGTKKTAQKEVVKKEKVVEKILTPEEKRDLKAKETVKSLLTGVDLEIKDKSKEELLEIDTAPISDDKGDMWLQEQVSLLSSENVNLRNELDVAKDSYAKIFAENQHIKGNAGTTNDGEIKGQVIKLFHELQANYMNMGKDQYTGEPNFRIVPGSFLNRLILFFPFLQQEKRF